MLNLATRDVFKLTQLLWYTTMEDPLQAKCFFPRLPNELIHQIYDLYLINTKLCLKLCCEGMVRELYKDLSHIIDFGNARIDRLCLDDTSTGSKNQRHVCSVYCLHRQEEFIKKQLIDLTLQISLSYQQLLNSRRFPLPVTIPYVDNFTFHPAADQSWEWTNIIT